MRRFGLLGLAVGALSAVVASYAQGYRAGRSEAHIVGIAEGFTQAVNARVTAEERREGRRRGR